MKQTLFIILIAGFALDGFSQTSFSQIVVPGVSSNIVIMNSYLGKKTIITVCSASTPDLKRLKSLDSLYQANKGNINMVVVPIQDFDPVQTTLLPITQVTSSIKKTLMDSLNLGLTVVQPGMGKKSATTQQSLLKWLTNASSNTHFDYDIANTWQTFVVNEKGTLFAVLEGTGDVLGNFNALLNDKVSQ